MVYSFIVLLFIPCHCCTGGSIPCHCCTGEIIPCLGCTGGNVPCHCTYWVAVTVSTRVLNDSWCGELVTQDIAWRGYVIAVCPACRVLSSVTSCYSKRIQTAGSSVHRNPTGNIVASPALPYERDWIPQSVALLSCWCRATTSWCYPAFPLFYLSFNWKISTKSIPSMRTDYAHAVL